MKLVTSLILTLLAIAHGKEKISIVYEWSQLEFDYATEALRQKDIDSKEFIPGSPCPIDVDVYYPSNGANRTIFITIPRMFPGAPITLGTVTNRKYKNNPIIAAYPSLEWHQNRTSCKPNRLLSVFRVQVDECGRLWVLDSGQDSFGNNICPPQILAFELTTNKLLYRYEIPASQYTQCTSIFVTIIADVRTCDNTFVYASDCGAFGLVVYDVKNNASWRIDYKLFYPTPKHGTFDILGTTFDLMDGLLAMALTPYRKGKERYLFFDSLASDTKNHVKTSQLQTRNFSTSSPNNSFYTYPLGRGTQEGAIAIDNRGIMYFGLDSDVTFNCWNTRHDYNRAFFGYISNNANILQWIGGIKVINNRKNQEEVWFLSSRFQLAYTNTMNPNETNFRIIFGDSHELTEGTVCVYN